MTQSANSHPILNSLLILFLCLSDVIGGSCGSANRARLMPFRQGIGLFWWPITHPNPNEMEMRIELCLEGVGGVPSFQDRQPQGNWSGRFGGGSIHFTQPGKLEEIGSASHPLTWCAHLVPQCLELSPAQWHCFSRGRTVLTDHYSAPWQDGGEIYCSKKGDVPQIRKVDAEWYVPHWSWRHSPRRSNFEWARRFCEKWIQ